MQLSGWRKCSHRIRRAGYAGPLAFFLLAAGTAAAHTVRYVSHDGSNETPYLGPETAGLSIQDAVDASGWGDMVVPGQSEYREAVTMKNGVTLVGTGDCAILPPWYENGTLLTGAEASTLSGLSICNARRGVLVGDWTC